MMSIENRSNLMLLVIDDEKDALDLLKEMLEDLGYQNIITASGGVEGLSLAREHKPDLIFLDIMMPIMDGPQVMEELQRDEEMPDIPVIIQTSLITEDEVERKGGKIHNNIYISKPYQPEQIEEAIRRALS